jgi:pseudouridine-5'-phosphate glycosidase
VAAARSHGTPLVALESTIITHGMPYPQNIETALRVEAAVRAAGAVPATIAVRAGRIHIGLSAAELESLGQATGVMKLSRADLAACLAMGRTGATTVAATMICARLAGIDVFATGGIGGVHRGAETSFDISADLHELAATPVTVIAAGAKAILDLPKTLEVLETLGVPVIAFGQDDLPAFWSRTSGLRAPLRMDSAAEIAAAHLMRATLGLPGGQLVTNPIPAGDEISRDVITPVIATALAEAQTQGILAKAVTPFLLDRIFTLTGGRSLAANVALVLNNARLGAAIATEIAQARRA